MSQYINLSNLWSCVRRKDKYLLPREILTEISFIKNIKLNINHFLFIARLNEVQEKFASVFGAAAVLAFAAAAALAKALNITLKFLRSRNFKTFRSI